MRGEKVERGVSPRRQLSSEQKKEEIMKEYKTKEPSEGLRRRSSELKNRVESLLTENSYQTVQYIEMERLIPFKNQCRRFFDEDKIKALADTIKQHGIRQPLTVIQSEDNLDKFEIVSGERRYKAAEIVGLDKVPCIIIHNRNAAEEIALIENVQRENLHPIELGQAYKQMLRTKVATSQTDLAEKIGVPRTQINEYLYYADFPSDVASFLIGRNIFQRNILRKVARCNSKDEILNIIFPKKKTSRKKKILEVYVDNDEVNCNLFSLDSCDPKTISKIINRLMEVVHRMENNGQKIVFLDDLSI